MDHKLFSELIAKLRIRPDLARAKMADDIDNMDFELPSELTGSTMQQAAPIPIDREDFRDWTCICPT